MKKPPSTQCSVVDDAHILIQEITEYNPSLGGLRLNAYRAKNPPFCHSREGGNPVTILSHSLSGLSGHPSAEGQAPDPTDMGQM
jgi:hypothetical protein